MEIFVGCFCFLSLNKILHTFKKKFQLKPGCSVLLSNLFPFIPFFVQFIQTFLSENVDFFLFHEGRTCFLQLGRKVAFLPKYMKAAVKHQIPFNVAFCLGFALGGGSPAYSFSKFSYSATDFRIAALSGKRW